MIIVKPTYFDTFRCIAGRCPDSCCKEWDVLIDSEKAALYRALPGSLGERLRSVLKDEDGEIYMEIENGRCPMWRTDGLCRIQAELGEEALCKTCREFPRLTHDYGNFMEYGLELSCPEAARIILSTPNPDFVTVEIFGGEEPEYDELDMKILLRTREEARRILSNSRWSVGETLALLLLHGYRAQAELNGAEVADTDDVSALENTRNFARSGDATEMIAFFKDLEILTPQWTARLDAPSPAQWDSLHLTLARYFVDRYWLQAISDFDLVGRVKFVIVSCLLVKALGGDSVRTAQLYSKEVENSIENVEAILDGVYESRAFTDDRLLGLLLL